MSKCVVLIGPPCSGKSTIGKKLAESLGYKYISSGDIARQMAEEDGNIDNLNAGNMAPEDRMRQKIAEVFNENSDIILDGFPRFLEQWTWMVENFEHEFAYIVIDAPILMLFSRVAQRGRADDDAFMNRMEYYIKNTMPMTDEITNYCEQHNIPTMLIINKVIEDTISAIERYLHDCSWIR